MKKLIGKLLVCIIGLITIFGLSCEKKNPPCDEIPVIKDVLYKLEQSVKDRNAAGIDSLIIAEANEYGCNSTRILSEIYPNSEHSSFYSFGPREFLYTKDQAIVKCFIKVDIADTGRPVEIIMVKAMDQWFVKRFDIK